MKTDKQINAAIDKLILQLKADTPYLFAGILMSRLVPHCDESDIMDIIHEIEVTGNYNVIKIESLPAQMAFDEFKAQLEANPYQQPQLF